MRLDAVAIHVTGVVQGVGFRPFVYSLAKRLALNGWVRNTSAGVDIEVDGSPETIEAFIVSLQKEAPPLARIDSIQVEHQQPKGFENFDITHSQGIPGAFQPISADVCVCADCLKELFDPRDRRYRYPFINCTNCGPRFTIIKDIPYDRPFTTMVGFKLCPSCEAEYYDPTNRRFHAQPVACSECGPHVWLEIPETAPPEMRRFGQVQGDAAIQVARQLISIGKILAIKGLGGFHLACDATNPVAVAELRHRKLRVDKPFALMMPDMQTIEAYCLVSAATCEILNSPEHPITILQSRKDTAIAGEVAPGQNTLGVMLPYTPLHYLLLQPEQGFPKALVMTSGNLSEEPIATDNEEARQCLSTLADAFLMHNRDIYTRCDDAVVRVFQEKVYPIRRSRGYVPVPIHLLWDTPPLLAVGGELKNTFCLLKKQYGFLSHFIGDLENYETMEAFEQGIKHFETLFRVKPQALAYDLHPDYLATRYALERAEQESLPACGVQHHHAHIAACMADNAIPDGIDVIGVSFDGTGYGEDKAIWGGEFLLTTYSAYQRLYHLAYVPLLGGDLAVRQPWRLALTWLEHAGIEWSDDLPPVRFARQLLPSGSHILDALRKQLHSGLNSPPTSSMGRLFDAVAALTGIRQQVNYEAQAAIELEAQASMEEILLDEDLYSFEINAGIIEATFLIQALVNDLRSGLPPSRIAARFHNSVAMMVSEVCQHIRQETGVSMVALSGGVWQNMTLLAKTVRILMENQFEVILHHQVPPNDGGLALGQAIVAIHRLEGLP
jgi:hydrogenase maturation protein HypF